MGGLARLAVPLFAVLLTVVPSAVGGEGGGSAPTSDPPPPGPTVTVFPPVPTVTVSPPVRTVTISFPTVTISPPVRTVTVSFPPVTVFPPVRTVTVSFPPVTVFPPVRTVTVSFPPVTVFPPVRTVTASYLTVTVFPPVRTVTASFPTVTVSPPVRTVTVSYLTVTVSPLFPPATASFPTVTVFPPVRTVTVSYLTVTVFPSVRTVTTAMTMTVKPAPPRVTLPALPPASTVNYETAEYRRNYGLFRINAVAAYRHGYFGQGVTVGIVDSGILTSHSDLAPNIVPGARTQGGRLFTTGISDSTGHGTQVAGVVGAVFGGPGSGGGVHGVAPSVKLMPLQWETLDKGFFAGNHYQLLFDYALSASVQIINNSWGGLFRSAPVTFNGTNYAFVDLPFFTEFHRVWGEPADVKAVADKVDGRDVVLVWSAGNTSWNEKNLDRKSVTFCKKSKRTRQGIIYCPRRNQVLAATQREALAGLTVRPLGGLGPTMVLATMNLPNNSVGEGLMAGPLYDRRLLGRMVAVVATDKKNKIADFSNGCGDAMYWCMAAPGVRIGTTGQLHRFGFHLDTWVRASGTSFSAPHVSGALAVLRSRLSSMPMSVVLAVLFHTAKDLGDPGVDPLYGHGLVDLGAAVSLQGVMRLAVPGASVAGSFSRTAGLAGSRMSLPFALRGAGKGLDGVSVAVNYFGDYHYDMPLSELLSFSSLSSLRGLPRLGRAAGDLYGQGTDARTGDLYFALDGEGRFSSVGWRKGFGGVEFDWCGADCRRSVWEDYDFEGRVAPFFSEAEQGVSAFWRLGEAWELFYSLGLDGDAAEEYRQYGLRWRGGLGEGLRLGADWSRIDEGEGRFLGGRFSGAFAVDGGRTQQGELRAEGRLSRHWLLGGGYLGGWSEVRAAVGSGLRGSSGVRFSGWRLGLRGEDLLRGDDRLLLGVTRHPRVRSGALRLRTGRTGGSAFDEDLHLYLGKGVRWEERDWSLAASPVTTWRLGYLYPFGVSHRVGLGLEWRDSSVRTERETAFSMDWRFRF